MSAFINDLIAFMPQRRALTTVAATTTMTRSAFDFVVNRLINEIKQKVKCEFAVEMRSKIVVVVIQQNDNNSHGHAHTHTRTPYAHTDRHTNTLLRASGKVGGKSFWNLLTRPRALNLTEYRRAVSCRAVYTFETSNKIITERAHCTRRRRERC